MVSRVYRPRRQERADYEMRRAPRDGPSSDIRRGTQSGPGAKRPVAFRLCECQRLAPNKQACFDHLLYEATVEDPKVFARPWKISMPLYRRVEPRAQLLEYDCYVYLQQERYKTGK